MKVCKILSIVLLLSALPVVADTASEPASAGGGYVAPTPGAPVWSGPRAVLYDNGPFVTHPGGGAGGADESWLQTGLGMGSYGMGHQLLNGNRIADQFTIPPGEIWDITNITFFAYQTGASTASTITAVNVQITDAMPPGGTVVFGDQATNIMSTTAWSNTYRTLDTSSGNTDRAIMASVCDVVVSLGEGTYWVDWQSDGSLASGPWAPPLTVLGQTTTGDALQYTGSWAPVEDVGGQGFPFIVEGTVQGGGGGGGGGTGGLANPIPTLSKTGVVVLILALIGISAVLIRRRM